MDSMLVEYRDKRPTATDAEMREAFLRIRPKRKLTQDVVNKSIGAFRWRVRRVAQYEGWHFEHAKRDGREKEKAAAGAA